MSAAILGNWSMFGVLAIAVVARAFEGLGQRAMAMGPVALLGAGMFIVSSILMNAWMESDDLPTQLYLWRYGILIDALLYLAIYLLIGRPRFYVFLGAFLVIVLLHLVMISPGDVAAKQIAEACQMVVIAAICVLCFRRVRPDDLIGLLFWGVLALNEIVAALFYIDCQFAHGLFGTREAGSACVQVYGFDPTAVAMWLGAALCAWLLFRWFTPRRP